jgi:hypothetical protein
VTRNSSDCIPARLAKELSSGPWWFSGNLGRVMVGLQNACARLLNSKLKCWGCCLLYLAGCSKLPRSRTDAGEEMSHPGVECPVAVLLRGMQGG